MCLSSASDARQDVKLMELEKAECERLDRELFHGMENALSVTDVKVLLEKLNRMEELISKCYSPEESAYRNKLTPLMREDFKAIIGMTDGDQHRALEAIRSSRYQHRILSVVKNRTPSEISGRSEWSSRNCLAKSRITTCEHWTTNCMA